MESQSKLLDMYFFISSDVIIKNFFGCFALEIKA